MDLGVPGFTDTEERRESFDFINYLYPEIPWAHRPGGDIDPEQP